MPDRYETQYSIGQDNVKKWGMDIHHPVFAISAFLITAFVVGSIAAPEQAKAVFSGARGFVIEHFDWLFIHAGNLFIVF